MVTRLELRTAVRQHLEDASATPLWPDDVLNKFLAEAVHDYGTHFPREQTATIAVAAGDTRIAVTPRIESDRVCRVFDADGFLISRQHWRWWNSTLIINRDATNPGNWLIEYLAERELPNDDQTAVEIIPGDEEIVIQLAIAAALQQRMIDDGKRGFGRHDDILANTATRATARAHELIAARRRRFRASFFDPS